MTLSHFSSSCLQWDESHKCKLFPTVSWDKCHTCIDMYMHLSHLNTVCIITTTWNQNRRDKLLGTQPTHYLRWAVLSLSLWISVWSSVGVWGGPASEWSLGHETVQSSLSSSLCSHDGCLGRRQWLPPLKRTDATLPMLDPAAYQAVVHIVRKW